MLYFGGTGVAGSLHPSLRAYIDCFASPPFPRMFPRGGGIWDQDPILMRDFRSIRTFELEWKGAQEQMNSANPGASGAPSPQGDSTDLESMLNEFLESEGLDGDASF